MKEREILRFLAENFFVLKPKVDCETSGVADTF
jgi:hypothetical protein